MDTNCEKIYELKSFQTRGYEKRIRFVISILFLFKITTYQHNLDQGGEIFDQKNQAHRITFGLMKTQRFSNRWHFKKNIVKLCFVQKNAVRFLIYG